MLDDILIDVMGCLDYGSLVALSMSYASFLDLITRFEDQLARRQHFQLIIRDDTVALMSHRPFRTHIRRHFIDHIAGEDLDEVTEAERVNAANEAILREVSAHLRLFEFLHVEYSAPSLSWAQLSWATLVRLVPAVQHAHGVSYTRCNAYHHVPTLAHTLIDIEQINYLEWLTLTNASFEAVASLLRHEQARRVPGFRCSIYYEDAQRIHSLGTEVTTAICDVSLLEENEVKFITLEGPFAWSAVFELIQAVKCAPRRLYVQISSRLLERPIRSDDYFAFAKPLPLSSEGFEEKCVAIQHTLRSLQNTAQWGAAPLKMAYVSANVTVFSEVFGGITITNSPRHIEGDSR